MLAVADGLATGPTLVVSCHVGIHGRGGQCFSDFYPLMSVLATPLVWFGRAAGRTLGAPQGYAGHLPAFIVPALATAGSATLSGGLSARLGARRRAAVATAAAVAFSTEMLTYSRSFFAETLVACLVVAAIYGLTGPSRGRWIGAAAIALAILAKPQTALFGPAVGLALALYRRQVRPLIETCAATLSGLALYCVYNWYRFRSPTNFGGAARRLSASDFAAHKLVKAVGLLAVSPGRGFIWYSPVAALGLVTLWRRRQELIPFVCLAGCLGLLVPYLGNPGSGYNWGSRYLVPMLPLMCVALGTLRGRLARLAVALAVVGFIVQAPNVVGFYERFHREQSDRGIAPVQHHWSVAGSQLVGVWPATVRQVRAAAHRNPHDLVSEAPKRGAKTKDQALLNTVALWWWALPAIGIPWTLGLIASLAMIAAGAMILARLARSSRMPSRGPPDAAYWAARNRWRAALSVSESADR